MKARIVLAVMLVAVFLLPGGTASAAWWHRAGSQAASAWSPLGQGLDRIQRASGGPGHL